MEVNFIGNMEYVKLGFGVVDCYLEFREGGDVFEVIELRLEFRFVEFKLVFFYD